MLRTFLTWNGHLAPFYRGLLIKVIVRCTYGGKTDNRCVMLKAEGTHVLSRRPLRVSSEHAQHTSEENAAMHDYEYVHYPCLVDRGSTLSKDKRRCERSEDNKLVIWSKNSSGNPTQTNQSTQATPPRLPYQRLLTRVTSTPPPEGDVSAPIASPTVGLGEEFPYQKLIKTVASTESSGQQRNDNEEKPEADVSLYDETSQKQYQSLSLKRNPTSCPKESDTGYMLMEGASPPERIYEYDYTEPLQPNTLFRISHGDTEQVIVQVSIGDLSDVALSEHQLQQQQRQPYDQVITSLANTDENYEDIENMNVKNSLPTEGNDVGHGGSEYKSLSAGCYENLSGENEGHLSGRRTDPEEYVEMGERRSVLVSDYADQSGCSGFPNIDEEGPEYHVLEELETSENKKFDDGDDEDDDENEDHGDHDE
ncbi:uncharacterized protein [Porites lutea]|uniref:uncharacterized protein isoform X3 n=1 Tax=Porites lutea TaxID=51062 RepID=UPI003CC5972F